MAPIYLIRRVCSKKGLPFTEATTKQWNSKSHSSKPISLAMKSELHNRNTSLDLNCGFCQQADILEHLFWYYETPRLVCFASPITSKQMKSCTYHFSSGLAPCYKNKRTTQTNGLFDHNHKYKLGMLLAYMIYGLMPIVMHNRKGN